MMYRAAINNAGRSRGLVGNQYKKTDHSPPPSARHESKEEEKPRPSSPEHSRATAFQLRAMDDFIELPNQERWKELVNTFRRHSRRRRRSVSHHCDNSAVESPFERELKEKMKDRKNTPKYYQHERDYGSNHSADGGAKHNTSGASERPSKNAEMARLRGKSIMSAASQEHQKEKLDETYRMRDECRAEGDEKHIAVRPMVDMTALTHRSEDYRDDSSATEVPYEIERTIVCTPVKSVEEIEPSPDDRNVQVQIMQAMPRVTRKDVISNLNTSFKVVCLDDVFESLRRFKEKNGNILVPVSHPSVVCFINKLSSPSQHEMEVLAQSNEGECHKHSSEDGSQRLIPPTNAKVTTPGTSHSSNAIISSNEPVLADATICNEEKTRTPPLLPPQMVIVRREGNDDDVYRAPTSENTFSTKSIKLILGLNILLRMLYGVSMSALVFVQIVCETYAPRRFHHWQ